MTTRPLAPGSVSLRLYPHLDLAPSEVVEELRTQAALASEHSFDGVMTSEHHGGFGGYLPNPLQAAGWCLEAMPHGWAAPCPLLLPLRPTALVVEEIAWLAARFPGRVGLGVAAGALPADFELMRVPTDDLTARFATALGELAAALDGSGPGALGGDPAVAACADHPVPLVSAAMGLTAVRRAASFGAGVLFDSLSTPARCRTLTDAYRDSGGRGPSILIRRAWVGEPPRAEVDHQVGVYRSYSSDDAVAHWGGDELIASDDATEVADALVEVARGAGADALNLRVHVPGLRPEAVREQIERLGRDVVPLVSRALGRDDTVAHVGTQGDH
jgi:alkanesulfonate monooxygenase SsuD/methylene tetrahydromethanopterin reductase-like flavin-dependent oxidoreductase (luciferase family)